MHRPCRVSPDDFKSADLKRKPGRTILSKSDFINTTELNSKRLYSGGEET